MDNMELMNRLEKIYKIANNPFDFQRNYSQDKGYAVALDYAVALGKIAAELFIIITELEIDD